MVFSLPPVMNVLHAEAIILRGHLLDNIHRALKT